MQRHVLVCLCIFDMNIEFCSVVVCGGNLSLILLLKSDVSVPELLKNIGQWTIWGLYAKEPFRFVSESVLVIQLSHLISGESRFECHDIKTTKKKGKFYLLYTTEEPHVPYGRLTYALSRYTIQPFDSNPPPALLKGDIFFNSLL